MSASPDPAAPLEAAAARVEADGKMLAEALSLRLRGPRVALVGDASAVLGPLLRRAQVTRGIFRVFNEDIARARAPLALVPRDPPLPPDLTPLAFVAWGARIGRGLPSRKANAEAVEACERVGLGPSARVPLGRSAPFARRLTLLAHAAALDARLVVVEDLLEGLGPSEVGALLRALDQAVGKAHAIVSTPRADATSPGQALARGADEVVLLEGGRVLEQGRPDEVFTAFAIARSAPSPAQSTAVAPPTVGPAASVPISIDAPSFGPPPSQRKTRIAPEPVAIPTSPDTVPPSQRATRLPDQKGSSAPIEADAVQRQALVVEPAPLTRRAEGVETALPKGPLREESAAPPRKETAARLPEGATPERQRESKPNAETASAPTDAEAVVEAVAAPNHEAKGAEMPASKPALGAVGAEVSAAPGPETTSSRPDREAALGSETAPASKPEAPAALSTSPQAAGAPSSKPEGPPSPPEIVAEPSPPSAPPAEGAENAKAAPSLPAEGAQQKPEAGPDSENHTPLPWGSPRRLRGPRGTTRPVGLRAR